MSDKEFPYLKFHRELPRELPVAERVRDYKEIHDAFVGESAANQAARCVDCGNPYCSWGCPLHNRIPQWLKLVRDGRIEDAASLMYETNPLPEICGRVCPHERLCEGPCTMGVAQFGSITIGAIEHWATDEALKRGWKPVAAASRSDKRVAVVGAGPAGLAAADRLARAGVEVVVFDAYEEIGGLLTFGIPPFKLDKDVVATRRGVLEDVGVRFRLNTHVGRDVAFADLERDFDAVFVGTGTYGEVEAELPGRDAPNVLCALPFLIANARRLRGIGVVDLPELAGKRVVVLGGGDTAMDCVRTSIRMNAASVVCAYRRDEANMPGSKREVKYARDEGVQFLFHRQPLGIVTRDGLATGVRMATTQLIADAAGRARPQIVPGSEELLDADIVIVSFGILPNPPDWVVAAGIGLEANGRLRVGGKGRLPQQTDNPKVFAGGDNVRGADLVVRAVRDGREAAKSILLKLGVVQVVAAG